MSDPTALVRAITIAVKEKLRAPRNMAKSSWVSMTDAEVNDCLLEEIEELLEEMCKKPRDWNAVLLEAVDVVNFAAMGADPERRKFNEPSDTLQE